MVKGSRMGEAATAQFLLFGGEEVPQSLPSDLQTFFTLTREHGGIIPMSSVAGILGVSHERIRQLVASRALASTEFMGKTVVLADSLKAYMAAPKRKAGRPRLVRAVVDGAQEIFRD
jgi:hypothetical protein